jgi:hypothetical protein
MNRLRPALLFLFFMALHAPAALRAQNLSDQNESFAANFHRDLVQEKVNLSSCGKFTMAGISGCAETLATGTPFHISFGSLAPQNGVAFGLAAAEMYHPTFCAYWLDGTAKPSAGSRNACHWSWTFNADAGATSNQSWRAGFFASVVHLSTRTPKPHLPGEPQPKHPAGNFSGPSATVNFYAVSTSLNRLYFYGLGPTTTPAARSDFGLTETILGSSFIVPVHTWGLDRAGIAVLGETNGRFPSERGSSGDTSPSIEKAFTETTAPGLTTQSNYFQAGEGIRFIPDLPSNSKGPSLALNYLASFQQFVAPSNSAQSFRRFTADLNHDLTLYTRNVGKPRPPLPPIPGAPNVPPIAPTRDVTGSLSARLFIQESIAGRGSAVPFYLQPTIGGSDLNGQSILASYPDYRFRAPNLLLIHGAYEQSLGKIPIGAFIGLDEAKVGLTRGDIAFDHLRHTYSAGFTIHAGGLPVVYLLFAWGGSEGHHTIANISTGLLGSQARPSLF